MERMTDYKPQERQELEELYRKQNVRINELEQENKKLKEKIKRLEFDVDAWHQLKLLLEGKIKKLKEDVDFYYKSAKQFREDAESWRKECERLLGLQICGKTVAERIEDDKKVVRE